MNGHDLGTALKEVARCKFCAKPIKDCICKDREAAIHLNRECHEIEDPVIFNNKLKIGKRFNESFL